MPVQKFRKMSSPESIVTAVLYDGTNLSEVAELGAEIEVKPGGHIYVRHYAGFMTSLPPHVWVVLDPRQCPVGHGVSLSGTLTFPGIYGNPLTDEQVNAVEQCDPSLHRIEMPSHLKAEVYGENISDLVEAAVQKGKGVFGEHAWLDVGFPGPIRISESSPKGRLFVEAYIDLITEDED
jgi:hypothetical protein